MSDNKQRPIFPFAVCCLAYLTEEEYYYNLGTMFITREHVERKPFYSVSAIGKQMFISSTTDPVYLVPILAVNEYCFEALTFDKETQKQSEQLNSLPDLGSAVPAGTSTVSYPVKFLPEVVELFKYRVYNGTIQKLTPLLEGEHWKEVSIEELEQTIW